MNKKIWKRIISALLALMLFIGDGVLFLAAEDDIDIDVTEGFITETVEVQASAEKPVFTVAATDFETVTITLDPLVDPTDFVEFEIQRSTKKSSGFKKVGADPATYADTGLKTGTTYYYRARAKYNDGTKDSFGPFTAVKKAKPVLDAISAFSLAVGTSSITATINPVLGATGYQVVYATKKNFKDKKTKTFVADASNNYTLSGLAGAKTYFVKARPFITIGKKKVYGPYSAVVSDFVNRAPLLDSLIGMSDMKVKGHTFTSKSDTVSGKFKYVQFTLKNNGTVSLKLKNKVGANYTKTGGYGWMKGYYLANSKGKKKSTITIKPGQSVAVRVQAGSRHYLNAVAGGAIIHVKAVYDGLTYVLSCWFDDTFADPY